MKSFKNLFLPALLPFFMMIGCTDEDQTARLRITLVDDEGDYDEVNVDIQGVAVHKNENAGDHDNGWILLDGSNVGVKDLLEYTGGVELTLVDTDFPTGRLSQIRLLLGEKNTVTIGGASEPLETPSAEQSGLKLQVHEILQGGITYNFKLDFDAALSVIHSADGKYILSPVINVYTEALSGSIKGSVIPAEENVAVILMNGVDEEASTYAPAGVSEFLFADVAEGQYTIYFDPGEESLEYIRTPLENINVSLGEVTDVEEIKLDSKQ